MGEAGGGGGGTTIIEGLEGRGHKEIAAVNFTKGCNILTRTLVLRL